MSRSACRRSRRRALSAGGALALAWLGALTSCARFGFELVPSLSDDDGEARPSDAGHGAPPRDAGPPTATPDAGAAPDASAPPPTESDAGPPPGTDAGAPAPDGGSPPAPRCIEFGPFDPPTLVAGLTDTVSIGPALSDDALSLLYVTNPPYDIFIATRPDRDSPWSVGTALPGINRAGTDATPFLSDGGLTLLLASDRLAATPGYNDLMIATRPSLAADFSDPVPIANVNSPEVELLPHLSRDGLRLYFSSDRVNLDRDIWMATRSDRSAEFSTPTPVSELNTSSAEFGPTLGADELEVFVASDRPGGQGMDLWRAVRPARDVAFGALQNVAVLNGPAVETDPRLSADGSELFFSSSRNGNQVLWSSRRACLTFDP